MLSFYLSRYRKFRAFVGPRVWRLLVLTFVTGVLWFLVETSFIYVIQIFLVGLGFLKIEETFVRHFPQLQNHGLTVLLLFGSARALLSFFRNHFWLLSNWSFAAYQRERLFSVGLLESERYGARKILSLFSETINNAGTFCSFLVFVSWNIISCFLFFLFGFYLAPLEMLAGVVALGLFAWPLKWVAQRVLVAGEKFHGEWENINGSLISALNNHFLFKVYRQTEKVIANTKAQLQEFLKHGTVISLGSAFSGAVPNFLGVLIIVFVAYFSGKFGTSDPLTLLGFFYIF
ncbi:MAG: hypothetical protein N2578_06435, partial [Bdellovibrionaceae bacterium]|nr:hypothetical protein [Pseudobdellovibrionaceae bacterium]